jgi:hypothetical protein
VNYILAEVMWFCPEGCSGRRWRRREAYLWLFDGIESVEDLDEAVSGVMDVGE